MQSATPTASPQAKKSAKPEASGGDKRYKTLEATLKRNHYRQDALIEVLHQAQETFGYLAEDTLLYIARKLQLPLSRVYGVATFYHLFSLKPSGVHNCVVCMGTACYVRGGDKVMAALESELKIHPGETTPDGQVSLVTARCIGACGIAPAVVFDGTVAGQQTPDSVLERIHQWSAALPQG